MNIEELCMESTHTMEEYLKVLEHENILGQNDKLIETVKDFLKIEGFKNIKIV